jgi:hypothetical protein
MSVDIQQKTKGNEGQPPGGKTPEVSGPKSKAVGGKALNNQLLGVQQFDMTEEEVRIWDTKVGMAVGLMLLIGAGSALVFGTIQLINWINS